MLAQLYNVAVGAHRHADAKCRHAPETHPRKRRIGIAAGDGGDIADFEVAAIGAQGEILNCVDGFKCAIGTHVDFIGGGLDCAARRHRVLRLHGGDDGTAVDAQRRKFYV